MAALFYASVNQPVNKTTLSLRVFVTYRPPGVDIAAVMYLASLIECIHTYCLLNRVNVVTGDLNSPKCQFLLYLKTGK